MPKLIFISHEPLTKYLYRLFYMKEITKAGFEISYWDCSEILWKGLSLPDELDENFIRKIRNIQEFAECVHKEDTEETMYSVELRKDMDALPFFKILSDAGRFLIRFKLFENCVLPMTTREIFRSLWDGRILKDVKRRFANMAQSKRIEKAYEKKEIKPYDIVFSSTDDGTEYINHPDYDQCLQPDSLITKNEKEYIVYLDNYFPYHPDIVKNNPNIQQINIERHYEEMNSLFSLIESKFNCEIIIAAHPKSDYKTGVFGKRRIIKYQTRELIRNASLVLLHSSNAIAFAIGYNIPFMFISTSQYTLATIEYNRMRRLSSYFHAPIVTLRKAERQLSKWERVPKNLVDKYKYHFLTKTGIETKRNVEIIIPKLYACYERKRNNKI